MPINPNEVSKIISEAGSTLKSKMVGGVSKESAEAAINDVAKKLKNIAEEAMGKAQKEIQECKNKTANEIAEITSQKDTAVFNAKQEAEKAIETAKAQAKAKAKAEVKTAKAVKTGKEVQLENGNTRTRKINKNGAIMTTEKTPNGNKVSVEVEQLDGSTRKTFYDPGSGKRSYTKTNTDAKKTYEYDLEGLNGKLSKDSDLSVVKKFIETNEQGTRTLVQELANGGKILAHEPVGDLNIVEKLDKNGKLIEKSLEKLEGNIKYTKDIKYGDETISTVLKQHVDGGYEISNKIAKDNAGDLYISEKTARFSNRIETTKATGTNAFGDISEAVKEIKPLYEGSQIDSAKIFYNVKKRQGAIPCLDSFPNKAIVKLKDGRSIEYKCTDYKIYDRSTWSAEMIESDGRRYYLNTNNEPNKILFDQYRPDNFDIEVNLSTNTNFINNIQ